MVIFVYSVIFLYYKFIPYFSVTPFEIAQRLYRQYQIYACRYLEIKY